MVDDCEFCTIVAGAGDAHEVARDADAVAFLDAHPAAEGHTLVVPTTHREGLVDMRDPEVDAVFRTARRVAAGLERALDADGVSLFQSSGAAAGQDVFHVHVHVIPRYEDDDIRFAPARTTLTADAGEAVAARLRAAIPEADE